MNNVKDLIRFLQACPTGASLSEIVDALKDEAAVKQFLKVAINNGDIFISGKKRGAKYYAKGKIIESDTEKPVVGEAVFTKTNSITTTTKGVKFLKGGIHLKQQYVQYDSKTKKNVVIRELDNHIFNSIAIRREGRNYVMVINDLNNKKNSSEEAFKTYEDLRENLRVFLEL